MSNPYHFSPYGYVPASWDKGRVRDQGLVDWNNPDDAMGRFLQRLGYRIAVAVQPEDEQGEALVRG